MPPRVLFVSKPVVPPFHDGTKCLVRDLARGLRRHRAQVMGTRGVADVGGPPPPGSPGIDVVPLYAGAGSFAPTLAANARAALWLVARSRADLWHFVFAPNPRTSSVGRWARALRRVPVVQTIASPPATFTPELFFGDVVVAQSEWTRERVARALSAAPRPPRLEVIPPPIAELSPRAPADLERVRRELDLPNGAPIVVYPGDLEVSQGAETVKRAVAPIVRALPEAIVVFACRHKTPESPRLERALRQQLEPRHVRFTREVDLQALLRVTSVVLFPVDDLRGKVDLPISLLEAMRLGVPVVALNEGPLAELDGVARVPPGDAESLARIAVELAVEGAPRAAVLQAQAQAIARRYDAPVVVAAYEALYDALLEAPPGVP